MRRSLILGAALLLVLVGVAAWPTQASAYYFYPMYRPMMPYFYRPMSYAFPVYRPAVTPMYQNRAVYPQAYRSPKYRPATVAPNLNRTVAPYHYPTMPAQAVRPVVAPANATLRPALARPIPAPMPIPRINPYAAMPPMYAARGVMPNAYRLATYQAYLQTNPYLWPRLGFGGAGGGTDDSGVTGGDTGGGDGGS